MTRTVRRIGILPSWLQVWALNAVLAFAALVIYLSFLHGRPALSEMPLPWPLLAAAFALAELKVVEVHFRREAHSFSLSEFPAVIGLYFLSPTDYLLAVLVGTGAVLLFRTRQRIVKVAFNLANFTFVATVSLAIFALFVRTGGALQVQAWVGTFLATSAAMVLSALSIATVITLSGGAPQFEKLPEMLRFGGMVSFANTSLALLAVAMLKLDPKLLWLLVIPLAIVFVAYRAFLSEREKHERLELVYESSRILQHSPELDSTLIALLVPMAQWSAGDPAPKVHPKSERLARNSQTVQGKPVARWGRKARDLPREAAQLPICGGSTIPFREGATSEGEPGALHVGRPAAWLDGSDRRRRNAMVLIVNATIRDLRTDIDMVPESGHRWA